MGGERGKKGYRELKKVTKSYRELERIRGNYKELQRIAHQRSNAESRDGEQLMRSKKS